MSKGERGRFFSPQSARRLAAHLSFSRTPTLPHLLLALAHSPVKRLFAVLPAVPFLFVLASGLAACNGSDSSSPSAAAQLKVEDPALTRLEDGTRLFTAKIYNPTDQSLNRAQVQVTLLDANNRRVGTMAVEVSNIAARDTTAFRQPVDSREDVSGARVKSVMVL